MASGQESDVRGDRIQASVESMGGELVERVLIGSGPDEIEAGAMPPGR